MPYSIDFTTLEITDDKGVKLGHVIDAVRNVPLVAADVKAALDIALIAKQDLINDSARSANTAQIALDQAKLQVEIQTKVIEDLKKIVDAVKDDKADAAVLAKP